MHVFTIAGTTPLFFVRMAAEGGQSGEAVFGSERSAGRQIREADKTYADEKNATGRSGVALHPVASDAVWEKMLVRKNWLLGVEEDRSNREKGHPLYGGRSCAVSEE